MESFLSNYSNLPASLLQLLPTYYPLVVVVFFALIAWTLVWKALALWRAARNGHKVWFIVLLVVNTVGILEIIYYFLVGKPKDNAGNTNLPNSNLK